MNPFDFLTDEQYKRLDEARVFSYYGKRNYRIKKEYKEKLKGKMPAPLAFELLQAKYPYLTIDRIRKICQRKKGY